MATRQGEVFRHFSEGGSDVTLELQHLGGHARIACKIEGLEMADEGVVPETVRRRGLLGKDHGHLTAIVHGLGLNDCRGVAAKKGVSRRHKREHRWNGVQDGERLQSVVAVAVNVRDFKGSTNEVHADGRVGHNGVAGRVKYGRARVQGFHKRGRHEIVAQQGCVAGDMRELGGLNVHAVHHKLSFSGIVALV